MKSITRRDLYIALILSIFSFLFYWYEYRPSTITAECETRAMEDALRLMRARAETSKYLQDQADKGFFMTADKDAFYRSCLRANGMPD